MGTLHVAEGSERGYLVDLAVKKFKTIFFYF